ncbi:CD82 antigen [Merluccius polli]|uniref:CD82 antigen n=1 Tax=Merluccius polli TaxID=89951 RepID=A0AA47ME80_MERPO|nr:CD82 antigen [Merluccius polli]
MPPHKYNEAPRKEKTKKPNKKEENKGDSMSRSFSQRKIHLYRHPVPILQQRNQPHSLMKKPAVIVLTVEVIESESGVQVQLRVQLCQDTRDSFFFPARFSVTQRKDMKPSLNSLFRTSLPCSVELPFRSSIMGEGCTRVTKYFLFIFNLIFFLFGAVIMGFGLWLLLDNQSFIAVLQDSSLALKAASYILIGVGAFSMLMGFVGCLGAIYEIRCLLGLRTCERVGAGLCGEFERGEM